MKKRHLIFATMGILFALVFLGFVSAGLLISSIKPTSVNASTSYLYNLTINNTNSPQGINFTQVTITFPSGFSFNLSTNGTSTSGNLSSSGQVLSWKNITATGIIANGTQGYFWVNATASKIGTLNVTVSTLDTSNNTNVTSISVSVSDVTPPKISFASPTPSNASTLNQTYIPVGFTASDNVAVSNVTILLTKPSGSATKTLTSSPYSYNFTNLSNGMYKINATVYDTSGNVNSTGIRYVTLNFTGSLSAVSCAENWTCGNWSTCTNDTQTRTCTDQNSCGTFVTEPNTTQSCVSGPTCQTNWEKGNWTPNPCTKGETQIQLWTDLNNCSQPTNKTRLCPSTSQTSNSASNLKSQKSNSSVSGLFLGILGFIILSVIIAVVVLMRMKKRSPKKDFGYNIKPHNGDYGLPGNSGGAPPGNPPYPGYPRY